MSDVARLIVLVGPTASGKSSLGVWLAERLGGEVLVCDSTQLYRHFSIGTGKITVEEQRGIPHHLIDLVEPEELFTAGEYRRRAIAVLGDMRQRRKIPILTVGTGLYLRGLLEGLSDTPTRSEALRARLRRQSVRHGPAYLYEMLRKKDPEAAARMAPGDTQKVIRAVEVCLLSGKTVTEIHRSRGPKLEGFQVRKFGLMPARNELYARIEQRVRRMIMAGWLQEVSDLMARGISTEAKPFTFIGYQQLLAHLKGEVELERAILEIQQVTRRYAKRQLTWFRKESGVQWREGFGDAATVREGALEYLEGPTTMNEETA
jgi:tRNA dimethylallyltransferase